MKTRNYEIELMVPMQNDKEVIFNEAQNIIDSFCNYTINDFTDETPLIPVSGEKYIITNQERKNQICFCQNQSSSWQYLIPKTGMILFIISKNSFFLFINNNWQQIK